MEAGGPPGAANFRSGGKIGEIPTNGLVSFLGCRAGMRDRLCLASSLDDEFCELACRKSTAAAAF